MSSKRELECLKTLFEKTHCEDEFIDFLIEHKVLLKDSLRPDDRDDDRIRTIYHALKEAVKEEKILLLDFHWQLLPLHQIKLHIITNRGSRDFLYGY